MEVDKLACTPSHFPDQKEVALSLPAMTHKSHGYRPYELDLVFWKLIKLRVY